MREACLQEAPALTATPPTVQRSSLSMRLHFGKASPLCRERDCERQFRQLYAAVFQTGQQQEEADSSNLLQYADAHRTCSSAEARDRSGFVDVQLHNADAAVAAALQCVRSGGLQVGSRRVPVSWAAAAQPAETVRIVFMNPPLQFARQGFTRTVLAAAGYDDLEIVHEQLGFSRLVGDAAMRVPCVDSVVAFVRAADSDLILRQLPDAFECGDGRHVPTTIFVEGRSTQQPHKWQQEQQQRLRTKQRGRALQQERVLHAQQQEEHTSRTRLQLRAAWTQQQQQQQRHSHHQHHNSSSSHSRRRRMQKWKTPRRQQHSSSCSRRLRRSLLPGGQRGRCNVLVQQQPCRATRLHSSRAMPHCSMQQQQEQQPRPPPTRSGGATHRQSTSACVLRTWLEQISAAQIGRPC